MPFDLQNAIALTAVAVAAGYLCRQGWRTLARKKSGGCGSCGGGCATDKTAIGQAPNGQTLVTIDRLLDSAARKSATPESGGQRN